MESVFDDIYDLNAWIRSVHLWTVNSMWNAIQQIQNWEIYLIVRIWKSEYTMKSGLHCFHLPYFNLINQYDQLASTHYCTLVSIRLRFLKSNRILMCFWPFFLFFCSDHLFSDQLYMEMALTPQLQEIISNGSMVLSVIAYKNLTNFLPRMYFERNT